jgi:hypothetical protein
MPPNVVARSAVHPFFKTCSIQWNRRRSTNPAWTGCIGTMSALIGINALRPNDGWSAYHRSDTTHKDAPAGKHRTTVRADAREGDIGTQLGEIAKANPGVAIGSYPFFDPQHGPNTNVVLRAPDPQRLALAKRAVEDMLERVRGAQSSSA